MANRWGINGNRDRLYFLRLPKSPWTVTAAMKLKLLLGRKAITNLDSLLKSRDITLLTNICLFKAMVFLVVMYGCQSWTIKKAEYWRIDAFELWCWRRLLWVPWTARRSNQSILKEISPECSLKGLMLKLKLQYFGHLIRRVDSFEKTLMLGKTEGRRRRGQPEDVMVGWHHQFDGHEFEQGPEVGDAQESLACCTAWDHKESDMTERLNWTDNIMGFLGHSDGKESACNARDQLQSLDWEDSLEKRMASDSIILAWRIPWTEEPGELQHMESQRVKHKWVSHTHT